MPRMVTDLQAEAVEFAAGVIETYGPIAAGWAMLYKHCLDTGLSEPCAEHFVIQTMDALREP